MSRCASTEQCACTAYTKSTHMHTHYALQKMTCAAIVMYIHAAARLVAINFIALDFRVATFTNLDSCRVRNVVSCYGQHIDSISDFPTHFPPPSVRCLARVFVRDLLVCS